MSKKEILNRLNRTRGESSRGWTAPSRSGSSGTTGAAPSPGKPETEKRVSGTVIRRRRKGSAAAKPAVEGPLPTGTTPPVKTVRRRRVVEPEPVPATEIELEQPTAAPEQVEPEVGLAPVEPELPTLDAPAEPEPTPEPVAEPEAEAAPEAVESEPAAEPEVEAGAEQVEPEAAPAEPEVEAEATPEPAAEPEPVAAPEHAPTDAAAAQPAAAEAAPAVPVERPRFQGLGSAVVRPPPGYDPNDPQGSRRRAREAAEASVRATRPAAATAATPAAPWAAGEREQAGKEEFKDKTRGRPRRKPRRAGRVEMLMDDMPAEPRRRRRLRRTAGPKKASPKAKAIKRRVQVDGEITVANLAQEMAVKAGQVIRILIGMGQPARINDAIDIETAQLVAAEFEYEVVDVAFKEEEHMITIEDEAAEENLEPRPPVITIMGHVDHGKTSLLDYIRKAKVAAGEAGGITQHISSYQFEHDGEPVTFIDTPGHAAFTEMRARGANATDIVILVVAADDGVMPQTIESINHTRAAGVPIVVAINKCDKKGVNPAAVRQRLLEHDLIPEEYGGDTLMADVSAITGQGVSELLDAVMLQAEMLELHANPDRHAEGVVLEARLEKGRGPVASIIVQKGTLKHGDSIVVGQTYGRIRALTDFRGKKLKKAGPSTPVEIMGLNDVPVAGDHFTVVENDKAAKALAEHRSEQARQATLSHREKLTFEELLSRAQGGEIKSLNLVVKADVQGSLEALKGSLDKLKVEGVQLKVLHDGVGAISESDITLASTYGAVVVGFSIRPDPKARRAAEEQGIEIRTYKVIYELLDDIRAAMVGMLSPVIQEEYLGTAEVRATFNVPRIGTVAGCYVTDGHLLRNGLARLVRDGVEVWEGKLASLKRFKDDVKEVQNGFECGLGLEGFNDVKVGDTIQVFRNIEVAAQG
jgi:translation initiation factor IF-2